MGSALREKGLRGTLEWGLLGVARGSWGND